MFRVEKFKCPLIELEMEVMLSIVQNTESVRGEVQDQWHDVAWIACRHIRQKYDILLSSEDYSSACSIKELR